MRVELYGTGRAGASALSASRLQLLLFSFPSHAYAIYGDFIGSTIEANHEQQV